MTASADLPENTTACRPIGILVVEDNALIRLAVSMFLREQGYRVIEAADASEAMAVLLSGQPIRIVFSDADLTGSMDGLSLLNWIDARFPSVRSILTSGSPYIRQWLERRGGVLFVPKPYRREEVAGLISGLLAEENL